VAVVDAPSVFLLVFLVSMGLTIAMFALGVGSFPTVSAGHAHGTGHHGVHIGHHGSVIPQGMRGGHAAPPSHARGQVDGSASPFNMATMLAFVTWFSGAGYVLTEWYRIETLVASAIAGGVGLVGAGMVFFVLVRVLLPGQTPYLRAEDYELDGTIGRLTVDIRPEGTGELVFTKAGVRRVASARSADGSPIERETEVVVVRHERGIAYVQPFVELLEQATAREARDT
jgi:hypothetical protein